MVRVGEVLQGFGQDTKQQRRNLIPFFLNLTTAKINILNTLPSTDPVKAILTF
jgi:hypothetical protein